jgi:DNA-binding response OmpR family regulator
VNRQVLVVEDDHGLRDMVARALREHGFDVTTAVDGASALRTAAARTFDAVVLDIGLPDADGRDVCQAMRAAGLSAPVLFLTARDGVTDRLSGFAAGGDDYLGKPFHLAELVARLEVALRRSPGSAQVAADDLLLDPATHDLTGPTGSAGLTPTEFRLLARLLVPPREVVSRRDLVAAGWAHGSYVADNTFDQYVRKLRRKLSDVGSEQGIVTIRGVGYRVK